MIGRMSEMGTGGDTLRSFLLFFLAVGGAYAILKLAINIYRPFAMEKVAEEIQGQYDKLQSILEADLKRAGEDLQHWRSGDRDKVSRMFVDEEKLIQSVKDANESKEHEVEVYEKYVRLRERFVYDRKKLAEALLGYKRYLYLRLKHIADASLYISMLDCDGMTFEECDKAANESRIAIQESERRLDVLLGV